MNHFTRINSFIYYMCNLIFFFVNFIFIRLLYNQSLLGEITDNLDEITKIFFVENIWNPIDILFIIFAVGVLIYTYKNKDYAMIEMKSFRIIFLTILFVGAVILCFLYPIRNEGGSIFIALLLIIYLPALFHYCYVECAGMRKR